MASLSNLSELDLYPRFLRTSLLSLPEHPIHILDREEHTDS